MAEGFQRAADSTIIRIAALMFSGSRGQAAMMRARSGSVISPVCAPPFVPPLAVAERLSGFLVVVRTLSGVLNGGMRQLRQDCGLTVEQAAAMIGAGPDFWEARERAQCLVDGHERVRIAKALGVKFAWPARGDAA